MRDHKYILWIISTTLVYIYCTFKYTSHLTVQVCKGQQEYEDITVGLLYTILTDENAGQKVGQRKPF